MKKKIKKGEPIEFEGQMLETLVINGEIVPENQIEIVSETASIWKKLLDKGYVMTHPRLIVPSGIFKGIRFSIFWGIIFFTMLIGVNELFVFINIVTNYSYMLR